MTGSSRPRVASRRGSDRARINGRAKAFRKPSKADATSRAVNESYWIPRTTLAATRTARVVIAQRLRNCGTDADIVEQYSGLGGTANGIHRRVGRFSCLAGCWRAGGNPQPERLGLGLLPGEEPGRMQFAKLNGEVGEAIVPGGEQGAGEGERVLLGCRGQPAVVDVGNGRAALGSPSPSRARL